MQPSPGNFNLRDTFRSGPSSGMFGGSPSQSSNGGMFGGGGGSSFKPTINPGEWGGAQYDFSGINAGANKLMGTPDLNIEKYNPYQFSPVNYGRSSRGMFNDVYNQAYNTGAKPIMAQGAEAMRGLSQGFGANTIGGAASKTLKMRGAQNTGNALQNLSGSISSDLAGRRLSQDETQRAAMFNAANERQKNQASENFGAAGFNAGAAEKMSQDAISRATTMLGAGTQLPQLQMALNQAGMSPFMDFMKQAKDMANNTIQPGTGFKGGGK